MAARAAQGVGAALLLPGSIAAIADAYPDRAAQARALGLCDELVDDEGHDADEDGQAEQKHEGDCAATGGPVAVEGVDRR